MSSDEELSVAEESPPKIDGNEDDMDDLFGDDGSDQEERPKRSLDDEDIDSGDDEGRKDRKRSDSAEIQQINIVSAPVQVPRQLIPQPCDNELYLLKVPQFLSIDHKSYQSSQFRPPTTDHHSKDAPTPSFSAYNTAMSTIRWRNSPSNPEELQSNARVLRWSDGSLTLQIGTDPAVQYEMVGKSLAPPQINPPKPTPTMLKNSRKGTAYDQRQESWTYVCAPLQSAYAVRTVGKITAALQVQIASAQDAEDDLNASIAALSAKYGNIGAGQKVPRMENFKGDPAQFERDAQKLEKELQRKQRKEERDREKAIRPGRPRMGGLTVDDLEGEGTSRPRSSKPKIARRARRDEYSDEEDELYGRRGGPEDTYDMEDDFLVETDEEGEEGGSEDAEGDEDDEEIDDIIARNEKARRQSPKRTREEDNGEADSRAKRRRVVSDDEEEDD